MNVFLQNAIRPELNLSYPLLMTLQEKVNYLSEDSPAAIFTQTYHHAASDSTPSTGHNELHQTGFQRRAGILHQW